MMRVNDTVDIVLTDGSRHQHDPMTLLQYTFDDACILERMTQYSWYHGDTSNPDASSHGLLLCPVTREPFLQRLTHDERKEMVHVSLAKLAHDKDNDDNYHTLIRTYCHWREHHCKTLVRCIRVLHDHVFRARGKVMPLSLNVAGVSHRMAMLAHYMQLYKKPSYSDVLSETRVESKRDNDVDALLAFFAAIDTYMRGIRKEYDVVPAFSPGYASRHQKAARAMFSDLKATHTHLFSKHVWGHRNNFLLFCFQHIALDGYNVVVLRTKGSN